MAATVTPSLVQQFSAMKPTDFARTIEPKWQVAQKLVKEIQLAVEKEHLTPLDGARTISSPTATLFGYDEFILRDAANDSAQQALAPAVTGARERGESPFPYGLRRSVN